MAKKNKNKQTLVPELRFPGFQRDGEWENKKLELALKPISRKRKKPKVPYLGLGLRSHGKGTFLKAHQSPEKNSMDFLYEVKENDLILNITFAWEGAIAIAGVADDGALVSHRFPTFLFEGDSAIPDFFRYTVLNKLFIYQLGVISPGGAGRNRVLNKQDFLELGMALPATDEQQKIADCLSSLDALIAAHCAKLDALQDHKKGLLQQLFPAEGQTTPALRFPGFQDSGDWEEKKLESLAKRGSGHTPSKSHPEYYNGGIKWVSLADSKRLDCGLIFQTRVEISTLGIENSSANLHPAGSVILSRDAGVGMSAVLASPMAVSQHFIVWHCDEEQLFNWFLYYVLQRSKPIFENVAVGSTIKTIGLPFFKEYRPSIPKPPEQKRIADCLSSLDNLISTQFHEIAALKTHKKGLMQQLFPNPELTKA